MQTYTYRNHGRWIVECPTCRLASRCDDDHGEWRHVDWGTSQVKCKWVTPDGTVIGCGATYDVEWPSSALRAAIEDAHGPRPAEARNWRAGVTVEELDAENDAYLAANGAGLTVITEAMPGPIVVVDEPTEIKLGRITADLHADPHDGDEYVIRRYDGPEWLATHHEPRPFVEIESTHPDRTMDELAEIVRRHAKVR